MKFNYLLFPFLVYLIAIIISCGNTAKVPDQDDALHVDTFVTSPQNIQINSLKIADTSDTFQFIKERVVITINDTVSPNDARIIIRTFSTIVSYDTTNEYRDSLCGMFVATWDPVPQAHFYYVYLFRINNGQEFIYDIAKVYNTSKSFLFLEPNFSYRVRVAAALVYKDELGVYKGVKDSVGKNEVKYTIMYRTFTDTAISKLSPFASADLFQPLPPTDIMVDYSQQTARINWYASPSDSITGYKVYLRDLNNKIIQTSKSIVDPSIASITFSVQPNTVYKVNIKSYNTLGVGILNKVYDYDLSTKQDDNYTLPYIHFSTYEKPYDYTIEYIDMKMVGVPGGMFIMGDIWGDTSSIGIKSQPAHEVKLSSFYMSEKEVTMENYAKFLDDRVDSIFYDITENNNIIKINTFPISKKLDSVVNTYLAIDTIKTDSIVNNDTVIIVDSIFNNLLNLTIIIKDTIVSQMYTLSDLKSLGAQRVYGDTSFSTYYKDTISDTSVIDDSIIFIMDSIFSCSSKVVIDTFKSPPHYILFLNEYKYSYKDTMIDIFYKDSSIVFETNVAIKKTDLHKIKPKMGYEQLPMNYVSWKGAVLYCNWLSDLHQLERCYNTNATTWTFNTSANGYRLPTEAEFEYVQSAAFNYNNARGAKQKYPWGFLDNKNMYGSQTTKLGNTGRYTYLGFADITGNVMEWCNDLADGNAGTATSYYNTCLSNGVTENPYGPSGPSVVKKHVLRGGSYLYNGRVAASNARLLITGSGNNDDDDDDDFEGFGFRVVRNIEK